MTPLVVNPMTPLIVTFRSPLEQMKLLMHGLMHIISVWPAMCGDQVSSYTVLQESMP